MSESRDPRASGGVFWGFEKDGEGEVYLETVVGGPGYTMLCFQDENFVECNACGERVEDPDDGLVWCSQHRCGL